MSLDRATLITEIRERIGNPSVTELSDNAIGFSIDAAVKRVSTLQPFYRYDTVNLINGTPTYTLASDIIDVRGFWCVPPVRYNEGMEGFDLLTGVEVTPTEYIGIKVFHSPSLVNILEEKWERLKSRKVYDWEFNEPTKELLVIPAPSKNSVGICKGVIMRTLSTINSNMEDAFTDLAMALSMETWSYKMSMIKSMPVGVGKIDYDTENAMKTTASLKKDAVQRLTGGGSGVVIG